MLWGNDNSPDDAQNEYYQIRRVDPNIFLPPFRYPNANILTVVKELADYFGEVVKLIRTRDSVWNSDQRSPRDFCSLRGQKMVSIYQGTLILTNISYVHMHCRS